MSRLVKGILIGVGVIALLIVGLITAGSVWWSRHAEEYLAATKAAEVEGAAFGPTVDNNGCIPAGLERAHSADSTMRSAFALAGFMKGCLEKSRPTPGFCDDAPEPSEFTKSREYATRKCATIAANDPFCRPVIGQVQAFCTVQKRSANPAGG